MANPHKGEVSFNSEGTDYTLAFTMNSLAEIEDASGKTFPKLSEELSDPERISIKSLRVMFWGGLLEKHPGLSLKDAGTIMQSVAGGMLGALTLVNDAFVKSFPPAEEKARPPKPDQN